MTAPTALLARALALLERFGTNQKDPSKRHLAMTEPNEHLGVCNTHLTYDPAGGRRVRTGQSYQIVDQPLTGVCAPSCQEWQSVVAALRAEVEAREPRQLELVS